MAKFPMFLEAGLADGLILDGKAVKGGFFVHNTSPNASGQISGLPSGIIEGTLLYCTADDKFYQYKSKKWGAVSIGERGPQGEQGLQGPTGPQGPTGARGPTGSIGPAGTKLVSQIFMGEDEKGGNIYKQIYDDNSTSFFTAPRGKQGPRGADGKKGDKGEQGPQGEQGLQGPIGEQGPQGESGVTTPINGFFTLSVDDNGDLWAHSAVENEVPQFEYTEETGDLFIVIEQ